MAGRKLDPRIKAELEKREAKFGSKTESYSRVWAPGPRLPMDSRQGETPVTAEQFNSLTPQGMAFMQAGGSFEDAFKIFGRKNPIPELPMNPDGSVGRLSPESLRNEPIAMDDLPEGLRFMVQIGGMLGTKPPTWQK